MKAYLLGILCAAMLCALADAVSGHAAASRKLVSGLFLVLAVLKPLGAMELPELELDGIRQDAQRAVQTGLEQAEAERLAVISERVCAYILTKADALGLTAQVCVELDPSGMPASVEVRGNGSPQERRTLTGWICRELGIGKEAVVWNDSAQSSE